MRATTRLVLLALALTTSSTPPPGAAPKPPTLDLAALTRQVHFAWREQNGRWSAQHSTYRVQWEPGGVSFTPFHFTELRTPVEGAAVRFASATISVGGSTLKSTEGRAHHSERGGLRVERDAFVEELDNAEDGVEQRWRFPHEPAGSGPLEVRIVVRAGQFVAATEQGLHFGAGALRVRYGHATWVDATGRRTPVLAKFEHGAIALSVPRETLHASVFPAVLDPIIGPELGTDQPVSGPSAHDQQQPALACAGAICLAVWQDDRITRYNTDVFGARVSAAGIVLDPAGVAIATGASDQTRPAVASNGTDFFVTWDDSLTTDLKGGRVSAAGAALDGAGLTISAAAGTQQHSTVAWDGTNYLVAWEDDRGGQAHIHGARVSAAAVVLDPLSLRISPALAVQQSPAVACGGAKCLVTWEDNATTDSEIHGALVDATGTVLNPADLVISAAPGRQQDPSVAWAGTGFLVAWEDARSGSSDLYGARVTSAGNVLDATGLVLSTAAANQRTAGVACDGTNCLVTWTDLRSGYAIYGTRVSAAGAVLDVAGLLISAAGDNLVTPAIAWTGTGYLSIWATVSNRSSTAWDIAGVQIDQGGNATSPSVFISVAANQQRAPALAWGGTSYLLVWEDARSGTNWDLFGARLGLDGALLDPVGLPISLALGDQLSPAVAWDGANYLVTWQDSRLGNWDIFASRVSAAGQVLDPGGLALCVEAQQQFRPALAFSGSEYLVTWEDDRSGDGDVFATRVSPAGVALDSGGRPISSASWAQGSPSVAWGGTSYLVAWADYRNLNLDIYAARVTSAGTVIDPGGLAIATGTPSAYAPAVAWDGTNYLVTWSESRDAQEDIAGALVNPAGLLSGGVTIASGLSPRRFQALAWDGASYVVAWEDARSGVWDLFGARVGDSGRVAAEAPLAQSPHQEHNAAVACASPGRCLVAWDVFDDRAQVRSLRVRARVIAEPSAKPASISTDEDTPVALRLEGLDPDGGALSFAVVNQAAIGALSGTPPNLTYTPARDWAGTDSFTFKVNNGASDSAPATVFIVVRPVDDAPTAFPQTIVAVPGVPLAITLHGADVERDPLTFALRSLPTWGTLTGAPPNVTYTAPAGFGGEETFSFVTSDGARESAEATVNITVSAGAGGGGGSTSTRPDPGCTTTPGTELTAVFLLLCGRRSLARSSRRNR